MLEYLAYKKYKTHQAAQDASPQPVLSRSDERFLSEAMDHAPVVILEGGGRSATATPGSAAPPEWADQIRTRWTGLKRSVSTRTVDREKPTTTTKDNAKAEEKVKDSKKSKEKEKEKNTVPTMAVVSDELELTTALDKLDLATEGGRAFSITPATKKLLEEFMLILKDVVNGVPTAYDDLVKFLETSSKQLEETFTSLPSFLQKLIKTLPEKLKTSPELLRFASLSPAATLPTIHELVAKPGMLVSILKSVLNVLKTRFPALLGVNVAMSLGLFVVLFMLWYCYKRGREERLKSEAGDLGWETVEMQQQPFLAQSAVASSSSASSSSKKGKGKTRGRV